MTDKIIIFNEGGYCVTRRIQPPPINIEYLVSDGVHSFSTHEYTGGTLEEIQNLMYGYLSERQDALDREETKLIPDD